MQHLLKCTEVSVTNMKNIHVQEEENKTTTLTRFSPRVAWSSIPLLARKATFFAWANFHFLSDSKSW